MVKRTFIAFFLATCFAAACTVHQTTAPSLSGPSEFATSIGVTASPDSINQDGGSQSKVTVTAKDAAGQPISGQTFRLDLLVNGSQVDYGTLSARTIVTGSDGSAFAIYTAPAALPSGATAGTCRTFNTPGALAGTCVSVSATPTGSNFAASQTQAVEIRLMPVGLILPPVQLPTAQFTTSPSTPTANAPTIFDGSSSCPGSLVTTGTGSNAVTTCQSNGLTLTGFQWSFGDGGTGTGMSVSHTYGVAQSFSASLTVTNSNGGTNTATKAVTVGAGAGPTPNFVVSPTAPDISDVTNLVQFNADVTTSGPGHTVTTFNWDFGDPNNQCSPVSPNSASGYTVTHKYCTAGTYTVTLSVMDDAGQKAVKTGTVTVTQ